MLSEERKAFERLSFKTVIIVIVLIAAFLLVPLAWNMLSPFIIAIPLAAMLQPVIRFCFTRLKIKKSVSSLILVILLLALVIGILIWVIGLLTNMVNPFLNQSEDIVTTTIGTIRQAVNSLMEYTSENFSAEVQSQISKAMNDMIGDLTKWGISVSTAIGSYLVNLATGFPYFIIYTTFLAMALFFIARDYDDIRSYLPGGKRRNQSSNTTQLTNSAIRSLIGYLRVQGTFSLMVLVVSLIYLNAFRFPYASAIAIVAGIMELIPMVGSGLLYILMGIIYLLTGNIPAAVQVLVLTAVLQLARRLLEPKFMSNSIGITPLESLIGMFVGLRFGGIPGLIGGPVLMSVLVGAFRGKLFESMKTDFNCIVTYLKNRWRPAEPEPAGAPALPAEPEDPEVPEPPAGE